MSWIDPASARRLRPPAAVRAALALALGGGAAGALALGAGPVLGLDLLVAYAALGVVPLALGLGVRRFGRPAGLHVMALAALGLLAVALSEPGPRALRLAGAGWAALNGAAGLAVAFSVRDGPTARPLAWAAVASVALAVALVGPAREATTLPALAAFGLVAGGLLLVAVRRAPPPDATPPHRAPPHRAPPASR